MTWTDPSPWQATNNSSPRNAISIGWLPTLIAVCCRKDDHRHGGVLLGLGVEPLTIGRDDQPMAVGRPGIDGTDHLVRGGVDDRDDGAILAGDVDHAVGRESERMRRNVRCEVDIADM